MNLKTALSLMVTVHAATVLASGVGARSGEMVADLPERLAALCLGWPLPGTAKPGAGR